MKLPLMVGIQVIKIGKHSHFIDQPETVKVQPFSDFNATDNNPYIKTININTA